MPHRNTSEDVVIKALVGNFIVTVMKFAGWGITQSPSLLAEGFHSLADTFNQILLLVGVKTSKDVNKGPLQFLYNFSSAIGVFILGGVITIYHAIHDIFHPANIHQSDKLFHIGIGIIFISFIIEGYTCIAAIKQIYARKGKQSILKFITESEDTTLVGIFLEDSAALLGLVLALVGMITSKITGSNLPDVVAALMIGLMMGFIAVVLLINNSKLLIGKAIDPEREQEIKDFLNAQDLVKRVVEIKTEILGSNRVNLYCLLEMNGTTLLDNDDVSEMIDDFKTRMENEDPLAPVFVDLADRTIRKLGTAIKELESEIKTEFPEITMIDFEVN